MKRREFLKSAGLGLAASAAVAAPAIAQSMPELKWRLTASWPKSLDTLWGACETFAKYVSEATDNKFQIQTFAAGEIVPALADARRGAERHRRDGPHRLLLLHRQGSDLGAVLRGAVRPQCAPAERLVLRRRRPEADRRVRRQVQHLQSADGQHRLPDGRLVPQGDQRRSRTSRASRCASAAGPARRSASSAWSRSRSPAATSIRRWRRAPSTPPSGSVPTTTRSSASTRSRKYYYYPGWWEGGTTNHFQINLEKWNSLPKNYQAIVRAAAGRGQCRGTGALRRAQSAGAEAAGRQRRAAAAVLPGRSWKPASRRRTK